MRRAAGVLMGGLLNPVCDDRLVGRLAVRRTDFGNGDLTPQPFPNRGTPAGPKHPPYAE